MATRSGLCVAGGKSSRARSVARWRADPSNLMLMFPFPSINRLELTWLDSFLLEVIYTQVSAPIDDEELEIEVQIEYIPEKIDLTEPLAQYFGDVFERFAAKRVQGEEPEVEIVASRPDEDAEYGSDEDE